MARNEVSRTFFTTKVTYTGYDTVNKTVVTKEEILPNIYKDETVVLKVLTKKHVNSTVKPVAIDKVEEIETLYTMPVEKFLELATPNAPRGTKTETENTAKE